eukprot:3674354-Rhodomonas_salina.3
MQGAGPLDGTAPPSKLTAPRLTSARVTADAGTNLMNDGETATRVRPPVIQAPGADSLMTPPAARSSPLAAAAAAAAQQALCTHACALLPPPPPLPRPPSPASHTCCSALSNVGPARCW